MCGQNPSWDQQLHTAYLVSLFYPAVEARVATITISEMGATEGSLEKGEKAKTL